MRHQIAILTPSLGQEPGAHTVNTPLILCLAQGVVRSACGACHVEVISYGESASRQALEEGLSLRVLPRVQKPVLPLDVLSWELPAAIANADLVHIHSIHTRSAEMALLIAKQQRKPICVSVEAATSSTLGTDLEILRLVDRVIDFTELGIGTSADEARISESDLRSAGGRLLSVYQSLLAKARAVAA